MESTRQIDNFTTPRRGQREVRRAGARERWEREKRRGYHVSETVSNVFGQW